MRLLLPVYLLAVAIVGPATACAPGTLTATFLDVGQGDAILVQAPNCRAMLVDAGGTLAPDPDFNGVFEDVNGNQRQDFADVVMVFNNLNWIAANEPVARFDYNRNGRITFADVVWHFTHL